MSIARGYHCVYEIHYHLVFPVKYRKALLDQQVIQIITDTAQGITERYAIGFEALGMDNDHIHLLASAHPKYSPGRIVQIFKSLTARELFSKDPKLRDELWGGEFWSDGYFVGTVSEKANWQAVEQYVKEQGKPESELQQLRLWQ